MRKYFLVFAILATVVCLYAFVLTDKYVTVSGVITEEQSGNGNLDQSEDVIFISDVDIFRKIGDGKEVFLCKSDGKGYYSVQVPKGKESKLRFTHSAYKDESVDIKSPKSNQTLNVAMELKSASKSKWW